jgi:tRNA modification GTPase
LAGALDLAQAEAVAATIRARSDHQLRCARRMMRGEWTETVRAWRDELADLLSLVVADIDFAEEPIDFIDPPVLAARITKLIESVDALVGGASTMDRRDSVPHVLLLGRPNAGKSTLLNRLSGVERAIASAVAGTTRDVLAVHVQFGDAEAILLDAAGIDDDPDEIIAAGRRRALEAASQVDVVCMVVDASSSSPGAQVAALASHADGRAIIVGNKIDLLNDAAAVRVADALQNCGAGPVCMVSAAEGTGLAELRDLLRTQIVGRDEAAEHASLDLTTRQRAALNDARDALDRAAALAASAVATVDAAELIALELREALDALGGVWGEVTTEDLLGRVFATFCIGK